MVASIKTKAAQCTANRSEQSPRTYSMFKLEVFGPGREQNFILFEPNQEKFEFFRNISANRLGKLEHGDKHTG